MRSRTAAALVVALWLAAPPSAAQTPPGVGAKDAEVARPPAVRLSPAALKRRAVTCKVPASPQRFHLRRVVPVNVEILIDERGRVRSAKVVSGHPLLHASAIQAAYRWTFRPVRAKGRRVTAGGILPLFFSADADEMERQCRGLRRAP